MSTKDPDKIHGTEWRAVTGSGSLRVDRAVPSCTFRRFNPRPVLADSRRRLARA